MKMIKWCGKIIEELAYNNIVMMIIDKIER